MKFSDLNLLDVGNELQMDGAVWGGKGKTLLCLFPGESAEMMFPLEMNQAEWEQFIRQSDIMETEVLTRSPDGKLAKVIARKSSRVIEANISWKVFKRDGYACRYCGNDSTALTVDHLVLWEEGGPSIEANLLSACKKCNKVRGNTQYGDWLRHPHYVKVSRNLKPEVRAANEAVLATLAAIPRLQHVKSR